MAIIDNPRTLDLSDIQGMVVRGYGKLAETAYFLLKIEDKTKAKQWMKDILPRIDSANYETSVDRTLHLAFAANGLKELGLNEDNLNAFPNPFKEGISTDNRNRILGDYGENDPSKWRWGSDNNEHLVLIFHAKDKAEITKFIAEEKALIEENGGVSITKEMAGFLPDDKKEPFGFHDGISQPVIKGSGRPGPENDIVAAGEFILGQKNEHDQYPFSPLLEKEQGNLALLKKDAAGSGKMDLGRNGTFMVFRQMQQHVKLFWDTMEEKTKDANGNIDKDASIKLASKCIGRWPSGASLVNFPDKDPGESLSNDDFGYAKDDPHGEKCPFGSHLRRNNPRDSFRWYDAKQSLKITRRHRIIRRGRNYHEDINGEKEIGLQFICFNANIQLQFEFIQHAWSNNNQMRHTTNDIDVIIGVPAEGNPNNASGQFTIQDDPVNEFVDDWKPFVNIKGGAYYFFPSISVINYLTTI